MLFSVSYSHSVYFVISAKICISCVKREDLDCNAEMLYGKEIHLHNSSERKMMKIAYILVTFH